MNINNTNVYLVSKSYNLQLLNITYNGKVYLFF